MTPPVLFLVFNRPGTTARVFEAIRAARPARLYVAADGPRVSRPGELDLCAKVRRVATAVDWPCELKILFSDQNLGCRAGVSKAIDWFFDHEQEGIILEDDCVPSPSFFRYCGELLDLYRNDKRVMCISGDNPTGSVSGGKESYFFSRYPLIWGWATWRRAWRLYDMNMSNWPFFRDSGQLRACLDDEYLERFWTGIFNRSAAGEIDTWDYQWTFSCWFNRGLTCIPSLNLVTNIGFGPEATHTLQSDSARSNLSSNELEWLLVHPHCVACDAVADASIRKAVFPLPPRPMTWLESVRLKLGVRTRMKRGFARFAR